MVRLTDPVPFEQSWRYKIGLTLIIVGHLSMITGLLLPVLGIIPDGGAGLVGVLILGGEGLSLLSIIFLGKAGFLAIKKKIFGAVKEGFATRPGPVRHYIGILCFNLHWVQMYVATVYAWTAFEITEPDKPWPPVWGLDLDGQSTLVLTLFLIGEIGFIASIYLLGADWWGKFRDLVVWNADDAAPVETARTA